MIVNLSDKATNKERGVNVAWQRLAIPSSVQNILISPAAVRERRRPDTRERRKSNLLQIQIQFIVVISRNLNYSVILAF